MTTESRRALADDVRSAILQREVARRVANGGAVDEPTAFRASIIDIEASGSGCIPSLVAIVVEVLTGGGGAGVTLGGGPTKKTRTVITVDEVGELHFDIQQLELDSSYWQSPS